MSVINGNRGSKYPSDLTKYKAKQANPTIDPKAMNTLVYNLGVRCNIYYVAPCPNAKSIDGQEHNIDCPICFGSGLIDSQQPIESLVGFLNQNRENKFNPSDIGSTWEEGTANGTFITGINLTYFTRIELPDFAKQYYQRVQRQEGGVDKLRYRAFKINMLVDKNGKFYEQDTDFEINSDGWIKWLPTSTGAKRPAKGVIYSINYDAPVVFRAIRAMHSGRYSVDGNKKENLENVAYPEQWLLKLEYLVIHKKDGFKESVNEIFTPGE